MDNKNEFLDPNQGELVAKIAKTPSFTVLLGMFNRSGLTAHYRLGQWFYNTYLKRDPWPELFYADTRKATELIVDWLNDHQYVYTIPRTIKEIDDERSK